MRILLSGSIAYDRIMDFHGRFKEHIIPEKIHILNVSFYLQQLKQSFGGTAGNIAYNLALLKEEPILVATHGNDFGDYEVWCRKNKIITQYSKDIKKYPTASVYIMTDLDDNQISGFYPGAMFQSNGPLTKSLLTKSGLAIVSPGNLEDMKKYPNSLRRAKVPYIYDPGQQITTLSKHDLMNGIKGSKVLISNDYEFELIKKKTRLSEKKIISLTETLITTLGSKGSVIKTATKVYKIPIAQPSKVIDPTGAGDAYRAGIIKGLIYNLPLEKIGKLAATISVYAVEHYGTQAHKFTWLDIKKRYKKNFKDTL
ncbi:MAG: carbohydrate kinase family protein [bacterium]|nr:carbohydrate kinase family protein [bacterium]